MTRFVLVCSLLLGCTTMGDGMPPEPEAADAGALANPTAISVSPADVTLTVRDGLAQTQDYIITAEYADGSTVDVTDSATVSLTNYALGIYAGGTFTSKSDLGGETTLNVYFDDTTTTAQLRVRIETVTLADDVPGNAAELFAAAAINGGLAPSIVYPDDATIFPPNLGDFEVHWQSENAFDLYEIRVESDYALLTLYVSDAQNWASVLPAEWAVFRDSARGEELAVSVSGMVAAAPGEVGQAAIAVRLTEEDIEGGIYYWATKTTNGKQGIWRHDMSKPGELPEEFYTTATTPDAMCVGCHYLSRDGTRMAVRYQGGNVNLGSVVDVATGDELLALDGTFKWSFAAVEPNGKRALFNNAGSLKQVDIDSGDVGDIDTGGGSVTHPDFSPAGDRLAYIKFAAGSDVWSDQGSLVVRDYNLDTGAVGEEVVLVPQEGSNIFYPNWSPDGQWLVFNQGAGASYDNPNAELWVVKADGSAPPIKLTTPNVGGGLTNSWARWTPFAQELQIQENDAGTEPVFWLTWSSKRAFGTRIPAEEGRPQLWMAPFFPNRAAADLDPSGPAFRLPFQDIAGNNHIAQWTERVVDEAVPVD